MDAADPPPPLNPARPEGPVALQAGAQKRTESQEPPSFRPRWPPEGLGLDSPLPEGVDLADRMTWTPALWEIEWWSWTPKGRAHIVGLIREAILAELKPKKTAARLPKLRLGSVDRYIAAVSIAIADGTLDPVGGRALLYSAQLLMSAAKAGQAAIGERPARRKPGSGIQPGSSGSPDEPGKPGS